MDRVSVFKTIIISIIIGIVACPPAPADPPPVIQADGDLAPELQTLLIDAKDAFGQNVPDGIPDIFQDPVQRRGIAGRFIDTQSGGLLPRLDGFSDEPSNAREDIFGAPFFYPCLDRDISKITGTPGTDRKTIKTPFNHGKVAFIYLPDSTGDPTDGEDDSVLYVGVDICNGDGGTDSNGQWRRSVSGLWQGLPTVWRIDYELNGVMLGGIPITEECDYGLPARSGPQYPQCPYNPNLNNMMVPFDTDGDGNPGAMTRFSVLLRDAPESGAPAAAAGQEAPTAAPSTADPRSFNEADYKYYTVQVYTCGWGQPTGSQTPNGEMENRYLGKLELTMNTPGQPAGLVRRFVGGTISPAQVVSHPFDNMDMGQIQAAGAACCNGLSNTLDVEYVIHEIDTALNTYGLTNYGTGWSINRLRLSGGYLWVKSGTTADDGSEDLSHTQLPVVPGLEVKKEVRCLGEGDDAWRTHVEVLPGATLEFRVTVQNVGNTVLSTWLTDILDQYTPGNDTVLTVQPGLQAWLCRPGSEPCAAPPNLASCISITQANAETYGLNQFFFIPTPAAAGSFLHGVANKQQRYLGRLNGVDICSNPDVPTFGDTVVLIFRATVDAADDFCETPPRDNPDAQNTILAYGDVGLPAGGNTPAAPNGDEVLDAPGLVPLDPIGGVDTFCERQQGFDDNVVTINGICRCVEFVKEVRILPNGPWFTGDDPLNIPNPLPGHEQDPIDLEYRYTVRNCGEVKESFTIVDQFLCQDVAALAPCTSFLPNPPGTCGVCPPGAVVQVDPPLPGNPPNSASVSCIVRFQPGGGHATTMDCVRAFLQLDDGRPDCRAVIPGTPNADPECYKNCATATATPVATLLLVAGDSDGAGELQGLNRSGSNQTGSRRDGGQGGGSDAVPGVYPADDPRAVDSFDGQPLPPAGEGDDGPVDGDGADPRTPDLCGPIEPIPLTSHAIICNKPCAIAVTKKVKCLTSCDLNEQQQALECASTTGWEETVKAFPDTCLMFKIEIENTSPQFGICRVRIKDDLEHGPGNYLNPLPGTVKFTVVLPDNTTYPCPVPLGFNTQSTWFEWDPASCNPPGVFPPGAKLRICFVAKVPTNADPAVDIVNQVEVQGAKEGDCQPSGEAAFSCFAGPDTATVDVEKCGFTVEKDVKCGCTAVPPIPPDSDFCETRKVLPGEQVMFRFRICNTGTIPIKKYVIRDCMTCSTTPCPCTFVAGSVKAYILRGGSPVFVTSDFAAFQPDCTQRTFTLSTEQVNPGECLTILFCMDTDPNFNTIGTPTDCTNTVTVSIPADGLVGGPYCGQANCGEYSDSSSINLLVPKLDLDKKVAADCENNGSLPFNPDYGPADSIEVCPDCFPMVLRYQFKVTNSGETRLTGVSVCDPEMITDAKAAGISLDTCSLCDDNNGCVVVGDGCTATVSLDPGQEFTWYCSLIIPDEATFLNWAARDSTPVPPTPCGPVDTRERCYQNCARATSTAANSDPLPPFCERICGVPRPLTDVYDTAVVCVSENCDLCIKKYVRCVECLPPYTPLMPWKDAEAGDPLIVVPGACVEYCVVVTNEGNNDVTHLRFTDNLTNPGNLTLVSDSVSLRILPPPVSPNCPSDYCDLTTGTNCPPPAFNWNNIPFIWEAASCRTGQHLHPGESVALKWRATVSAGANPTLDSVNSISVAGRLACALEQPPNGFTCFAGPDVAIIDFETCSFTVVKQVKCKDASDGTYGDNVDVVAGGDATFRVVIGNTGTLPIDEITIKDCFRCTTTPCPCSWLGNLAAKITPDPALPGTDVTAELIGYQKDCVERTFPLVPPLGPGEYLVITYDVHTDANYQTQGVADECCNDVFVRIPSDGLPDDVCGNNCTGTQTDTACIDITVPKLACEKLITATWAGGTGQAGPSTNINLTNLTSADFPLTLEYRIRVWNPGEVVIRDIEVCDDELVADLVACGLVPSVCDICSGLFDGFDDQCYPVPPAPKPSLDPGQELPPILITVSIPDLASYNCFAEKDGDENPRCYRNIAKVVSAVADGNCPLVDRVLYTPANPLVCNGAIICLDDLPCCIETSYNLTIIGKQGATIWYCPIGGGGGGPPTAPPLPDLPPAAYDWLTLAIHGVADLMENGPYANGTPPLPAAAGEPRDPPEVIGAVPSQKGSLLFFPALEIKWNAQGQVIQDSFVSIINDAPWNVRVKWYFVQGDPYLDAVYSETEPPVLLERMHPGCNRFDTSIYLTGNQPTYFSILAGGPLDDGVTPPLWSRHVPPFWTLDPGSPVPDPVNAPWGVNPGRPDTDPLNPGGRVIRGYAVAWAVNDSDCEISWNHLSGSITNIDYRCEEAWEYKAWAFRVVSGAATGQRTDLPLNPQLYVCGELRMDGVEYEWVPDMLLLDYYAWPSTAFSTPHKLVAVDTDLTLWPPEINFCDDVDQPCTLASFLAWNEMEQPLSNSKCICCWDQEWFSLYFPAGPNIFDINILGTDKGKTRIDSPACPDVPGSKDTPLLGVQMKCLQMSDRP